MRKRLLNIWFVIYAVALFPSWCCAVLINWYEYRQAFVWASPLAYARHSRSTLNALVAAILWFVAVTVWEVCRA